jgi:23S rRNA (cytosine1962-C5)-methyltransferase
MPAKLYLKEGKERPVLRGHPWIFSGAIESVEGCEEPGELCDIYSHNKTFLARGYINRRSQITSRILTREERPIDVHLFRQRIQQALKYRQEVLPPQTNAYRLINSEGDFLPGLVVDVYEKGLCCQFFTAGMERWKPDIVSILKDLLDPAFIYERSDVPSRAEEGLATVKGLLFRELKSTVEIQEHGHRFQVDIAKGQKTGFFLDQRENRRLFASLAKDRRVCDCFCYTGAFAVYAVAAGAKSALAVDSSKEALELFGENIELNGPPDVAMDFQCQDAFQYLRHPSGQFDLVVLDPPPFARRKGDVPKAARGYKDLNMWALKMLPADGILFTFSCSQAIDIRLFQQIVFSAALDAKREVQIIHRLGQPSDHPVSLFHPEGEYLKGLVLRVTA